MQSRPFGIQGKANGFHLGPFSFDRATAAASLAVWTRYVRGGGSTAEEANISLLTFQKGFVEFL